MSVELAHLPVVYLYSSSSSSSMFSSPEEESHASPGERSSGDAVKENSSLRESSEDPLALHVPPSLPWHFDHRSPEGPTALLRFSRNNTRGATAVHLRALACTAATLPTSSTTTTTTTTTSTSTTSSPHLLEEPSTTSPPPPSPSPPLPLPPPPAEEEESHASPGERSSGDAVKENSSLRESSEDPLALHVPPSLPWHFDHRSPE
ncbi:hypothetical protein CRUP_007520, partial [Coryphaenoides rupestris]